MRVPLREQFVAEVEQTQRTLRPHSQIGGQCGVNLIAAIEAVRLSRLGTDWAERTLGRGRAIINLNTVFFGYFPSFTFIAF